MILHKCNGNIFRYLLSILILSAILGLLGCDNTSTAREESESSNQAEPLLIDRDSISSRWAKHEWGEFKSDVLNHYSNNKRRTETSRFEFYESGEFRKIAGKTAKESLNFADGRFYGVSYAISDASRQDRDQLELEVAKMLGTNAKVEQFDGFDGKPEGSRKVWQIGAVRIFITEEYGNSYAWLGIENTDVRMRRNQWAK